MEPHYALSTIAIVVSFLGVLLQHLFPAWLMWYRPLVFSLDDERTDPKHRHRPAIAIALTIHNAGALTGIVWDTMVAATRLGDSSERAVFQPRKFASDIRYVTVLEIEEHARPPEPIAVCGRETKTVVVRFEQRSNRPWRWRPGRYAVAICSLDANGRWKKRTSFTFTLGDDAMDERWNRERVIPCQRWTDEALANRDAFITSQYVPRKGPFWMFWKRLMKK